MGFHNILSKADRAVVAFLVSEDAGDEDDTLPFKRADNTPKPPFTIVASTNWDRVIEGSVRGALIVKTTVEIHTNAAPGKGEDTEGMVDDSEDRVQLVGDALSKQVEEAQAGDGLADLITAAARGAGVTDFTCLNAQVVGGDRARSDKGNIDAEWLDSIELELICIPRDVD